MAMPARVHDTPFRAEAHSVTDRLGARAIINALADVPTTA
jgi:hypothetical protein